MKPLLAIGLFGLILFGAIKLGKHIGKARDPKRKNWEPSNTKEDQSNSMFV